MSSDHHTDKLSTNRSGKFSVTLPPERHVAALVLGLTLGPEFDIEEVSVTQV